MNPNDPQTNLMNEAHLERVCDELKVCMEGLSQLRHRLASEPTKEIQLPNAQALLNLSTSASEVVAQANDALETLEPQPFWKSIRLVYQRGNSALLKKILFFFLTLLVLIWGYGLSRNLLVKWQLVGKYKTFYGQGRSPKEGGVTEFSFFEMHVDSNSERFSYPYKISPAKSCYVLETGGRYSNRYLLRITDNRVVLLSGTEGLNYGDDLRTRSLYPIKKSNSEAN